METEKIDLEKIKFDNRWEFPSSLSETSTYTKTQKDFVNEYYPSGHKIFNRYYYPDLSIEVPVKGSKTEKRTVTHEVKRIALALQSMSIDVIMPHLLGNDIVHKQVVLNEGLKNDEAMTQYKKIWEYKNTFFYIWKLIENSLICGEAALYFYFDNNQELRMKVLSYLDGDSLCPKYDSFGNLYALYRKYKSTNEEGEEVELIDVIDKNYVRTYNSEGEPIIQYTHSFNFVPIVFHRRRDGAFWTKVQSSIDALELNISSLSEDNRSKSKGKYHIKATNPKQVQSTTIGGADVIVTDPNGDFKLINPVSLSTAFQFEYEVLKENIFDPLGIIFLKMKASGDMPTGTMKLLFYPSERVCKQLIKEYAGAVQQTSNIFKKAISMEYPTLQIDKKEFIIQSNIQLFVPSDDIAMLSASADAFSKGGMTFDAVVRANPKFLDPTDLEHKREEDEEKARLQRVAKEPLVEDTDTTTSEDTPKE